MHLSCLSTVDTRNQLSHTMLMENAKPIVNDSDDSSQAGIERSHPDDGLRILARIIARDLLARRSVHAKNNDVQANDEQVSANDA